MNTQRENHVIDCDAKPFCPKYWKVFAHKKSGEIIWNSKSIVLSRLIEVGKLSSAQEIPQETTGVSILNAAVLDYLLSHPYLMPEEWKNGHICFWGTIYSYKIGNRDTFWIRRLVWMGNDWQWEFRPIYVIADENNYMVACKKGD